MSNMLFFKHNTRLPSVFGGDARLNHPVLIPLRTHIAQCASSSRHSAATELVRLSRWRENTGAGFIVKPFGLTIRVTKNNVFMVAYSTTGQIVFWLTRGRKNTNFNLYTKVCSSLVRFMFEKLLGVIKELQIGTSVSRFTVYGRVPVKKLIIDLRREFFKIHSVRVAGNLAHNGCRLPKRRRGARN